MAQSVLERFLPGPAMPLPLVVALELLPFVDWRTLLQLRATSRVCDTYEATQQLAYELQQRAK